MMATTSYAVPNHGGNYYMISPQGSSPPEDYPNSKGAYGASMAQTPPSANISPTNFHTAHLNVRQLRQPRQPLYIPAALRPTDPPSRPTDIPNRPRAPDTPPSSKNNSFDSVISRAESSAEFGDVPVSAAGQGQDIAVLRRGLSRAASEGLDEELGEVTGPPTTAHWKPDVSSNDCAVCHQTFTWFFRRHHCRSCGDIVCDSHVKKTVLLDQNARYHPKGMPSKACDPCWREWNVVKRLRHSRASSIAGSSTSSQATAVPALPIPNQPRTPDDLRVGSMARSEGMVWSTF